MSLIRQGIDKFYEQDEEPSVFRRRGDPGFVMSDPPETTTPEPKPRSVPRPGETTAQAIRRGRQEIISPEVTPQVKPGESIRLGRQTISPSDPLYQTIVQQTSVPTTPAPSTITTPSPTTQTIPATTATSQPKTQLPARIPVTDPETGVTTSVSSTSPIRQNKTELPTGYQELPGTVSDKQGRQYYHAKGPGGARLYQQVGKPNAEWYSKQTPTTMQRMGDVAKPIGRVGKGALKWAAGTPSRFFTTAALGYGGKQMYDVYQDYKTLSPEEQEMLKSFPEYMGQRLKKGWSGDNKPEASSVKPLQPGSAADVFPAPVKVEKGKTGQKVPYIGPGGVPMTFTMSDLLKGSRGQETKEHIEKQINSLLKEFKYFIEAKSKD